MIDLTDTVRRRLVFYVPGYDPQPPRRYRELYRTESAEQSKLSGYVIETDGSRDEHQNFGWRVSAYMDGHVTYSEIEVLAWSDIVRASMPDGLFATYWQLVRTIWLYLFSGAFFAMLKLRKGPVLAALYPVFVLLVQALVAVVAGLFVYFGIEGVAGLLNAWIWPGQSETPLYWPALILGASLGLVVAYGVLRWFKRQDGRLFAHYLMHDYAFSSSRQGQAPQALDARMAQFRKRILQALQSDVDEVLVVGHSSGAHIAVSVVAEIIRSRLEPNVPAFSLLTLGHVIPMISFLPRAWQLRADLQLLSQVREVTWVDVSAPSDGACFALCDPVGVSGVTTLRTKQPLVLSARFTETLSKARRKALKFRYFRTHFQYLCSFDQPADYDYFAITAGPQTLQDRFAGRASSPSRIETAVSPHRSTSP